MSKEYFTAVPTPPGHEITMALKGKTRASESPQDVDRIQLHHGGVTQSFAQWTSQFVEAYYPSIGQRCYRVPALHFNTQRLEDTGSAADQLSALLLHPPEEGKARGDLAHTVVLEHVQLLGDCLHSQGQGPLFIISAFNYDNYLYRIKPPARTQGKENRPKPARNVKHTDQLKTPVTAQSQENASNIVVSQNLPDTTSKVAGSQNLQGVVPSNPVIPENPKDGVTSGEVTKQTGDCPMTHSVTLCGETVSQSPVDNYSSKTSRSEQFSGRDTSHQDVSQKSKSGYHVDSRRSKGSQTPVAELSTKHTSSEPTSHERADDNASDPWPSLDGVNKGDSRILGKSAVPTSKEQVSARGCPEDTNENRIESYVSPSSTSADKRKKKKPKTKRPSGNSQGDKTQALERLDGVNNDDKAPSPPASSSPRLFQRGGKPALPPRPKDMKETRQRGDIDVLLLHQHCGVILMEVKSTGLPHPNWQYTDQDIVNSVVKAADQLSRGRDVFSYIMADISSALGITLVVALPFVSRQWLNQALSDHSLETDVVFLCRDDLIRNGLPLPSSENPGIPDRSSPDTAEQPESILMSSMEWWRKTIIPRGTPLSLTHMKTIVGRICGLLSVVSVWTRSKPRIEVRTMGQAISESGDRVSDIVLLPDQADLLADSSLTRLCLTGPMGSGKTLLLQLKGRQWLREGRRVVIINVRTSGRGRPAGHVMEEAIGRAGSREEGCAGSVERHDLAIRDLDMTAFRAVLEQRGSTEELCFILDELTQFTFPLLEGMLEEYPRCRVWCVAMFVRRLPAGFHHFRLGAVLRSPPSVQLLLRELDLNPLHRDAYSTRSASRGLSCDGPPVIFIQHQRHDPSIRNYDCIQCADELLEILRHSLGFQLPDPQDSTHTSSSSSSSSRPPRRKRPPTVPKAAEAKSLSFGDVLFLVSVPLGYFKRDENGLWMATPEKVYKYCCYLQTCSLVSALKKQGIPLKPVIDNTSREIAFPGQDELILTDVMGVQSLERKVVIFLPGGPVLDDTGDANTHTPDLGKPAAVVPNDHPASSRPTQSDSRAVESRGECPSPAQSSIPTTTSCLSHQPLTRATLPSIVRDLSTHLPQRAEKKLSESSREERTASKTNVVVTEGDAATAVSAKDDGHNRVKDLTNEDPYRAFSSVRHLFGNMLVEDKARTEDGNARTTNLLPPEPDLRPEQTMGVKLRMGMDVRGDSPLLLSALENGQTTRESTADTGEGEKRDYFQPDSVFLVPDAATGVGHVEMELARIRQALSCMSMDDQDWLFMAAARCLSQLIVIVPSAEQAGL